MATHFHSHDNSTNIRYPDTVTVHEHKAPTDESIRLMEDAHDKAIKNIIAKVKVDDNLVKGECYCIEQPWSIDCVKVVFKFSINNTPFTLEQQVSRSEIMDNSKEINGLSQRLHNKAQGVLIWYCLKMFTVVAFEKITGEKIPEYQIKHI